MSKYSLYGVQKTGKKCTYCLHDSRLIPMTRLQLILESIKIREHFNIILYETRSIVISVRTL